MQTCCITKTCRRGIFQHVIGHESRNLLFQLLSGDERESTRLKKTSVGSAYKPTLQRNDKALLLKAANVLNLPLHTAYTFD